MVGFYHMERISTATTMSVCNEVSTVEPVNPVKSLVCSPDLSAFTSSTCGSKTLPANVEDKTYQCLLCQKIFDQKSLYQSHLRSHGKEGEDPYRCNICGKTFAVPARLTRHYRTHTGEKPYQCEYCSKSFSVKENLSVHRRIHTKERPYKCDVCERAFEHSGKLHRHMRIHTGERPHKCTVCSKTFIQSGQLVIHMRTHTGEKPYVCKACGKRFTCSKQLKVHTRTHTGEKPYTCDICGKSFGYNHVLKLHQVAHYGEKVYKCTSCDETFGSKKTVEMHIKTHTELSVNGSPRNSLIEPEIEISQANSANTASDKENQRTEEPSDDIITYDTPQEFPYYIYSREQYSQPLLVPGEDRSFQSTSVAPVEQPHLFLYPEVSPTYTGFGIQNNDFVSDCSSLLNLPGNDARRRVEAALEAVEEERQREYGIRVEREPILTPPSSNPVSPVPSPDPLDLAIPVRETLILPPRKRCKKILESMESERSGLIAAQRQNSVIQFAKAS
ncbi:kruppel homolog 1 [Osmia lignaria lignaria]|uniref:kruppel homolog 1 n=1 Tax=Osmia lignaria lignaria TaxID=1437193 RepID=UPI001478CC33|nr:zinc finger protein 25-like [Osmia lignaria]XP_034184018.1 zinc finger protein 25-like [Osmia lignaria]